MNDRKATRRRDIGLTAHSVSCSPHMLMLRVFTMLALATMIASPSSAQSVWDLAGDGNWNVATNWAPVGVPNSSTTDVIINTGANRTVSLNMDATIRDLLVGNGDILHVNSGRSLTSHGNILNDGLIVINPTGGNITTTLAVSQPMSLSGSGILRLGRDTQAYITGSVIHHGDTHTIEGVGRILADLVNNGTLRADATLGTGASLSLLNNNVTNNGLLWATENSTLALTSSQIVNHNGVIRADGAGSLVELNGDTTIIGGTLQTFNGGFFATGTTGTKTLIDVHNQGTIHLNSNRTLAAEGALVNDGLIRINPTTGNLATTFTASDVLLITGHGVIELNRVGTRANITGSQITQGADHTIHGVGQIEASLINYGTVRADGTLGQGTTLDLISGAKTNLGTFSAVNGGTLQVTSGLLTNYDAGTQTLTGGAYHVMGSSTMRLVGVNVQTLDAHITLDGSGSNFYSGGSGTASGLAPLE
ncbi:MAG TPA: hypothetical protein PKD54_07095, partial [Pirellulaceae bacterium]|nr:hypothetical protein [Pirellulaceae bacterium]